MRIGHAAALALAGWYLMVPPWPIPKYWRRPPLSQWENYKSFDWADECDEYRHAEILQLVQKMVAEHEDPKDLNGSDQQRVGQLTIGQCLASDDPRPKP
jgi:hypothetical protein